MPTVPVPAWEQVSIVIIFAFLIAGLGWVLYKIFFSAIQELNKKYAEIIENITNRHAQNVKEITQYYSALIVSNNEQWQKYFDARSETTTLLNQQVVEKLDALTHVIEALTHDFAAHDQIEREVIAGLKAGSPAARRKNA